MPFTHIVAIFGGFFGRGQLNILFRNVNFNMMLQNKRLHLGIAVVFQSRYMLLFSTSTANFANFQILLLELQT